MRPRCAPSSQPRLPSPKDNAHASLNPARRARRSQPRWLHPPRHQYRRRFLLPFTGRSSSSDRLSAAERGRCQGDPRTAQVRGLGLGLEVRQRITVASSRLGPHGRTHASDRVSRPMSTKLARSTTKPPPGRWSKLHAGQANCAAAKVVQPKGTMRALRQALKEQAHACCRCRRAKPGIFKPRIAPCLPKTVHLPYLPILSCLPRRLPSPPLAARPRPT
jgi:hypothetical protein